MTTGRPQRRAVGLFAATTVLFYTLFLAAPWVGAAAAENAPTLLSALRFDTPLALCGETVPLQVPEIRERFEKELLLALWDRPQVILWLKRSTRFLPLIEARLAEAGLPDDLKYVAVAESALRPHVGSRKGALGFWQFLAATGRKYGLRIDERIDERRSIEASTTAALAYFEALYATFGSWTLAAAAFNMGEEGLTAEILEQETDDFYRLYLPLETQRYLFRILAVKLIFSDPARYGFHLTPGDFYPPPAVERVSVTCSEEVALRVVAQAARTDFKTIKDLNPEIRGHYLAVGEHVIQVPAGAATGFDARFARLEQKYRAARREKIYIVKPGDNLSAIAERFGIPLAALIIWNRIDIRRPIHPGQPLVIFHGDRGAEATVSEEEEREPAH